ncbi:MAG: DUF1801 domain-containing protein [Pseudomonadota bacterium]
MPPLPADIIAVIELWHASVRRTARQLRAMCWDVAQRDNIGALSETLKWGEPAWRPVAPRTGSTLRIGWKEATPDRLNLYLNCKTDLAFRLVSDLPEVFDGNSRRVIWCDVMRALPDAALAHVARTTFTYHRAAA